ncbi:MAG: ferritin-like domain-containing protein [Defluviitaleaceae bacterium]|nr:ferritin-like domain-containing protein [Defluviitaleaceae bacterium]
MEFNEQNLVTPHRISGKMSEDLEKQVLELILEALKNEIAHHDYLGRLKDMTEDDHEKGLIEAMRLDEQKHHMLLSDIYYDIKGCAPIVDTYEKSICNCVVSEFARSILGKLENQEFYKMLLFAVSGMARDLIFDIMDDEGRHAAQFNYLFTKNKG